MSAKSRLRTIVAQVEGLPLPPEQQGQNDPHAGATSDSGKRNIPRGHEFDARALKPLSRALFSSSVALGHAITAYKEFSRVKSSSISPDGMMGGRGYVMQVKDLRGRLQQACELLSAVTDTLFDEMNAPYWKPKMAELGDNEAEDVSELVEEAGQAIEDPEAVGQKDIDEVESRNDGGAHGKSDGGSSKMPETGGSETSEATPLNTRGMEASWKAPTANSSLPVNTLPGPRVDHLDRGDQQTGPGGAYNKDEPISDLDKPRSPIFTSVFADASIPDASTDSTETEGNDFGTGYGAKGKGTDNTGEKGQSSSLPGNPGVMRGDGATPHMNTEKNLWAASDVPNDGPVSRSDYYDGDKGNQFNVSVHADSELPGSESATYNYTRDTPNGGNTYETQDVPYVKYDWTTHNYRNDPQDLYRYDDDKVGTNV